MTPSGTRRKPVARALGENDQIARDILDRLAQHGAALPNAPTYRPRPAIGWSMTTVSPALRATAGLLGLYLSYAVLRLQEIYPALNLPHLPMIMSAIISLIVIASMPIPAWQQLWDALPPLRWQALIVVLAVLTAPIGIWMRGSLTFVTMQYAVSLIVFGSTVILLRDRGSMKIALTVLLISAAVVARYTFSQSVETFGDGRVGAGITLDPNDLAQLFVALVPLALYLNQGRGFWNRSWIVVGVGLAIAIVPTQSRGGVLGIGSVALVLMSFGTSRWRRVVNIIGVILGIIGFVLVAHQTGGADRMGDFTDYSGGEGRMAIWKRGIYWMLVRPWGYGINNFAMYFGWLNGRDRAAHNSFVQIGMELGVLGLVSFTMIWFLLIRGLLRQRSHAQALTTRMPDARKETVLATMVIASSVGTIVTGFFLAKAYAEITLFVQGLGCAVLLGYPYRDQTIDTPAPRPVRVRRSDASRSPR